MFVLIFIALSSGGITSQQIVGFKDEKSCLTEAIAIVKRFKYGSAHCVRTK